MIDRGANGGLAGADMSALQKTHRKINIVGIDDHELTGLDVVTAAALLDTQKGPIIGIFHEYAYLGKDRSIHAAGQMDATLMTDQKLLVVPKELKPLMDMWYHFPWNLA